MIFYVTVSDEQEERFVHKKFEGECVPREGEMLQLCDSTDMVEVYEVYHYFRQGVIHVAVYVISSEREIAALQEQGWTEGDFYPS